MHDIIVRFPSKEMADYFITQVSDFCDISREMNEEVLDEDKSVFNISSVDDFSEPSRWPDERYMTFGERIRSTK